MTLWLSGLNVAVAPENLLGGELSRIVEDLGITQNGLDVLRNLRT
jgi:hypothetical protein